MKEGSCGRGCAPIGRLSLAVARRDGRSRAQRNEWAVLILPMGGRLSSSGSMPPADYSSPPPPPDHRPSNWTTCGGGPCTASAPSEQRALPCNSADLPVPGPARCELDSAAALVPGELSSCPALRGQRREGSSSPGPCRPGCSSKPDWG